MSTREIFRLPGKRMLRIGASVMVCNYLVAIISGGINFYLAARLGEDGYGYYSYAMLISTFVFMVASFGAERTLVRDLIQSEHRSSVMTASIVLRMLIGAVATVAALIWLMAGGGVGGVWTGSMGILLGLAIAWSPNAWFDANREMHVVSLLQLAEKVLAGVAIVALVGSGPQYALAAIASVAVLRVVNSVVQWSLVRRQTRLDFRDERLWREAHGLWVDNRFVFLATFAMMLTYSGQMLLAKQGAANFGQFTLALQVITFMVVGQNQLARLFAPRAAEMTAAGCPGQATRRELMRQLAMVSIASLCLVAPVFFAGPWLIDLFLPGRYEHAGTLLQILCLYGFACGPALVINRFTIGLRQERWFFVIAVTRGALSLALYPLAVPLWGAYAVAWGYFINHLGAMSAQVVCILGATREPQDQPEHLEQPAPDAASLRDERPAA
ncbi:MAG: lipopolysaccharide biosynthesis protein [Planctomycetales bacterium]|nr:lipopolysaccharide biosynthesis protein [Planctomycetales bacterium]